MEGSDFNFIADNLPFSMLLLTPNGRIIAVNRKASQLLQVLPEKLTGQHLSTITVNDQMTVEAEIKACSKSRTPCPVPLKLSQRDCIIANGFLFSPAGETSSALIALQLKTNDSKKNNFFILNEKIVEQNRVMRKLKQSQLALEAELELRLKTEQEIKLLNAQLEEKVRTRTQELQDSLNTLKAAQQTLIHNEKMSSLGKLVAGVSHEVSTPIGNCLLGISYILEQTRSVETKLDAHVLSESNFRHYLNDVEKLSDSLLISLKHTVKLLSSFKEIAVDQHSEEKRQFNLKDYCDTVLLNFKGRLKNTAIEVVNHIDPSIEIFSDAGAFSQIITNMVMNSLVHGIDNEGKIDIDAQVGQHSIVLSFSDNGKGIDQQMLDKIFDPFFSTKFGQGGSGLGLSIVHNLVTHRLKGIVTCVSEPNKGTKMIIEIPLSQLARQTESVIN